MDLMTYDFAESAQIFVFGVGFGLAASLFAGFLAWGISAVCRLFKNIIGGGR